MKKVFLEEFAAMTSQKALLTSNMVKGDYIHLKGAVLSKFAKVMSTYCLKFMILCTIYFVHSFSDDITCKCPNIFCSLEKLILPLHDHDNHHQRLYFILALNHTYTFVCCFGNILDPVLLFI